MKNLYALIILAAFSAFANDSQTFDPHFSKGNIPPLNQLQEGYNASADIELLRGQKTRPDLFFDVSFLYLLAQEGGLDLANSAALQLNNAQTGYISVGTSNSSVLFQDFDFKPGFKTAAGVHFDEWKLTGEYTWIRQTTLTSQTAPQPSPSIGVPVWILNNWYQQLSELGQIITATQINAKWSLGMDLADLVASRPYYLGRNLIIEPFLGARGAWIRQKMDIDMTTTSLVVANLSNPVVPSHNRSNSWGVGPRAGLNSSCLIGRGFRFEGDLGVSMLFTRYTKVVHKENSANSLEIPTFLKTSLSNFDTLRPELDFRLGFGWGSYLSQNSTHIDIACFYTMAQFWEQNMIRKLIDQTVTGTGPAVANLYLQGLEITARIDF